MHKKYYCALFALTLNCAAYADNQGFYLKAQLGESFSTNETFKVSDTGYWADRYNDFSNDIGNAFILGAAIGYRFNPLLRADLSYDYRFHFKYDKSFPNADRKRTFNIDNYSVMANLYLDAKGVFPNCNFWRFAPYIGAGVGLAHNTTKDYKVTLISNPSAAPNRIGSYSKDSFAWQLIVGSAIDLTQKFQLDFGYRYVNLGKIWVDTESTTQPYLNPLARLSADNATANELYLGLRYNFF